MQFEQPTAPHARPLVSVPVIMRRVLFALVPAMLCHTWYFGPGLLFNFALTAVAALLTEAAVLKLRGRPTRHAMRDCSALVTAALLSFALPPFVPFWIPLIGGAISITLAKQLYGGLGKNLFNPAMVGYVFLILSFPVEMTQWLPPRMGDLDYRPLSVGEHASYVFTGEMPADLTVDALTRATPLDLVKEGLRAGRPFAEIRGGSLFGDFGGRGWEWVANFVALGGLYLLYAGTIRWHIPTTFLAGLLVPATVLYLVDPNAYATPAFHLFSGATMLGAFFIATEPVSAAGTDRGRLIYGAGIGVLVYVLRTWGTYPDGVAFSVLLMNGTVPLINRYTRPRIYGQR
jgi:electron transport complex protein RnfD